VFVLGHAVLGSRLARAVRRDLPLAPLVIDALLPDLVDKPLYYALAFATGRHGAELGLISGTRTFGHTGLALLLVAACALLGRSRALAAVAAGMATHLVLDLAGDLLPWRGRPNMIDAILFPLLGRGFPITPYHGLLEHLAGLRRAYVLGGELLGALLLVRAWRRPRAPRALA